MENSGGQETKALVMSEVGHYSSNHNSRGAGKQEDGAQCEQGGHDQTVLRPE